MKWHNCDNPPADGSFVAATFSDPISSFMAWGKFDFHPCIYYGDGVWVFPFNKDLSGYKPRYWTMLPEACDD